jgi:hypothetical protein
VIHYRDDEVLVTDGRCTEGKEHIGGLTLIQATRPTCGAPFGGPTRPVLTLPIEVRPVMQG